jgi:uncharacterized membrane protein
MWSVLLASVACGPIPVLAGSDDTARDTDDPATDDSDAPLPTECDGLTWRTVGEPFVLSWCLSCHSENVTGDARQDAPKTINFDTREKVEELAAAIEFVLDRDDPTMPPVGGPSAKETERFLLWLDCGAPE